MKLIQKHFFKTTSEFELLEDSIVVRTKTLFNEKKTTISLSDLDPEPVTKQSNSSLHFNSHKNPGFVLSLLKNKPDTKNFENFVNAIKENILRVSENISGKESIIKAYSQRLTSPYSGLVQIVESERARALTMDGKTWEFQIRHNMLSSESSPEKGTRHRFSHALTVDNSGLNDIVERASSDNFHLDKSLIELAVFISKAEFPFPSKDVYEYWLLDKEDDSPLAMIFSCSEEEQMSTFPNKTEWTALPAAAMPIELTDSEKKQNERPVNCRVEEMVAERAGYHNPKARWFKRHPGETENFPPLLLREDWKNEKQADLCQRYLLRQSSRLLMLHHIDDTDRQRLEIAAKPHVFEVERFYPFYPKIIDQKLMNTVLVEVKLRRNAKQNDSKSVHNRRDGVLYL